MPKQLNLEVQKWEGRKPRNFEVGKYYIYITGWKNAIYFERKKDAEKFIRVYKKIINDSIILQREISQLSYALYMQYYAFLPGEYQVRIKQYHTDFNDRLNWAFNNHVTDESYVHWNAIRVAFDRLEDMISLMVKYGQQYKQPEFNQRIYAIRKMFELTANNFNLELKGIFPASAYRNKVLSIEEEQMKTAI